MGKRGKFMQDIYQKVDRVHSRRHFLYLISGSAGLAMVAACTAPLIVPDQPRSDSQGTIPPEAESKELIFWGYDGHPIDLAVEGFLQEHPEIAWHSPHPADYAKKITVALATGADLPDLYWATATEAQTWGCQKLLADLSEPLQPEIANYHPAKLAECFSARHDRYIGWPGDLGLSGWYYRADKFKELGWDEAKLAALTWPDFITMAAELQQQGLYVCSFPAEGQSMLFFLILQQVGGTAVSQNGKRITIGNGKGIDAMYIVRNLWESGGGLNVPYGSDAYWTAIKEGRLIGDFAPASAKATWEANLQDATDPTVLGNWRLAPLPTGDNIQHRSGIWGGAQLVMPKAAANKKNALLLMHYALATVDGADRYSAENLIPSYRPYLQSATCQAQRSPLFGDWSFCSFWANQEKELFPDYFRPAGWDAVDAAVQQEMMAIVLDAYSVEDGMSRIAEIARPEFDRTRCA
jgi:lactose/L-arabinose transport system substrate-binding protein